MNKSNLMSPKTITVGNREIEISLIPAIEAKTLYGAIMSHIHSSGMGDIAFTTLPHDIECRLLKYCAAKTDVGTWNTLDNDVVIESFLPRPIDIIDVVVKMIDYNFGFLRDGSLKKILGLPTSDSDQQE